MLHLSARQAGAMARRPARERLVLTHLVARRADPEAVPRRSAAEAASARPVESRPPDHTRGTTLCDPTAASPTSCDRSRSSVTSPTQADGSVLVRCGGTMVLCTASIDEDVPRWMRGSGKGWVTAEYSMLPGSSAERIRREVTEGKPSGRTQEIQRLIGRSLRAVCDMAVLGERQIIVDCDVLQADGGTRTASITGGYVALHDALTRLVPARRHRASTRSREACAAVSVGIVDGVPLLDLPYVEDSTAEVDMNVVMTESGRFVEVQGTAEGMAVQPRRARRRCSAWPRRASPRSSRCRRELLADAARRRADGARR